MSRKHSIDMRHNILQLSMVGVIILTVIGIVALTPFVRIVFLFFLGEIYFSLIAFYAPLFIANVLITDALLMALIKGKSIVYPSQKISITYILAVVVGGGLSVLCSVFFLAGLGQHNPELGTKISDLINEINVYAGWVLGIASILITITAHRKNASVASVP
ncbi:MAG: hypothetical protein M9941_16710 [Anaerolineae bacterium]|nr:hypothetical protein [Anaerolineae bacterium]